MNKKKSMNMKKAIKLFHSPATINSKIQNIQHNNITWHIETVTETHRVHVSVCVCARAGLLVNGS